MATGLIAILLLCSCTTATPTPDEEPPVAPVAPVPQSTPDPQMPDSTPACSPLTFTPETDEEYFKRDTLTGCTDGVTKTVIQNVSEDVVWIIDEYHWEAVSSDPKVALFRSYVGQMSDSNLMTLEPGMAARLPPSVEVHLRLDGSVQSAWATYEALIKVAADKGVDLVDEAVKKRRTVPALMYTCFRAGWETGKILDKVRDDPDQQLRSAVFFAETEDAQQAGVNCVEQISQLESDAHQRQKTPPVDLATVRDQTANGTSWSAKFRPFLKIAIRKVGTKGRG